MRLREKRPRVLRLAAALAGILLVLIVPVTAGPAVATATSGSSDDATALVRLRVEGRTSTIFEGHVLTRGHDVTTESAGTHHCDGTNNNANPTPGPTATSALDDAARLAPFTWDGTYWAEFDDILVTRIGDTAQTDTEFWGILRNYAFTPVGGCQQRVQNGDEILFAFDAFAADHFLKLKGPHAAKVGKPATVTVTDGATGEPIAGATVGGQSTGADGKARVVFKKAGAESLKAEHPDAVRSNALRVAVLP
ncbi:hypothetical protein [Streptomyces iconiensis]|uniref:Uncharacterized protein n=1 Tax=Streptomyces iconiensis TaxID=1384038 RepID=A0ABT7A177_9ACTN|nr:hypothetical protein [Streptomyces iconiensis]MDJ1135090.1 hypothetical protein [Streptomyces iconiensis]